MSSSVLLPEILRYANIELLDIHDCQTRNNHCLNIPSYKTTAGQRTFHYRAVKIWNGIDDELKEISELKVFKEKLKEHFLNF